MSAAEVRRARRAHWGLNTMAEATTPVAKPLRAPPLSPHLQIWRWHVTMAGSILHRMTGVALYFGAIGLALWLVAGASGAAIYGYVELALNSLFGQMAVFAMLFALIFHFCNGLRHLVWDAGAGVNPRFANLTGWLSLIITCVASVGIFALSAL